MAWRKVANLGRIIPETAMLLGCIAQIAAIIIMGPLMHDKLPTALMRGAIISSPFLVGLGCMFY